MDTSTLEQLRYPVGRFVLPDPITSDHLASWIKTIEAFPERVEEAIHGWSDEQLQTPYRPEGWTIRQLVHHVADSHMNSYIRFKWTLTEDSPTIKAYHEGAWAELEDTHQTPIEVSLQLLKALHQRWGILLKNLTEEQLNWYFIHPEHGQKISLKANIGLYDWHCRHHLQHILELKKRKGW